MSPNGNYKQLDDEGSSRSVVTIIEISVKSVGHYGVYTFFMLRLKYSIQNTTFLLPITSILHKTCISITIYTFDSLDNICSDNLRQFCQIGGSLWGLRVYSSDSPASLASLFSSPSSSSKYSKIFWCSLFTLEYLVLKSMKGVCGIISEELKINDQKSITVHRWKNQSFSKLMQMVWVIRVL